MHRLNALYGGTINGVRPTTGDRVDKKEATAGREQIN